MIIYNPLTNDYQIGGQTIPALGQYAVPVADQVAWAGDPVLRASVGIGVALVGYLACDGTEMVISGTGAWAVLDSVAQGLWLPQDQTVLLASAPAGHLTAKPKPRPRRYLGG